jgi:chemotaxis signal transduction protein
MSEHVAVRCGDFRLLFPVDSIQSIRALTAAEVIRPRRPHLRGSAELPLVDLRRLLRPSEEPQMRACAGLHWISEDGERDVFLVVDSVDQIVYCQPSALQRLPALPQRIAHVCDAGMRDADGSFWVRIRPNARWPLPSTRAKREFLRSLIELPADIVHELTQAR